MSALDRSMGEIFYYDCPSTDMVRRRTVVYGVLGVPFGLEYAPLPCNHHKVAHHHVFEYKSKFHESNINSRVVEALPYVFDPVDLNIERLTLQL